MPRALAALLAAALSAARAGPPEAPLTSPTDPGVLLADAAVTPTTPDPLAASAGPSGEQLAGQAALGLADPRFAWVPDVGGVAVGALAPAPSTVVRETRYYGTVTIDHRAHLARRARCVSCHGPGPVRKIEFTPKVAHERCIGCHQEVAAGPEKCQGCHVRPPPPPEQLAAAQADPAPEPPRAPEPNPEHVSRALAAFDAPAPVHRMPDPFTRRIEAGVALGTGVGLAVRFVSTQDLFVLTESLEMLRGGELSRTLLLLGGGLCRPLNRDIVIETGAVAGVDALDRPVTAFFPVAGLRAAVQFRQPGRFPGHLTASLTWTADLSRRAFEREVGGYTFYGTVSTGFKVP